jgi:hypothetical protein
MSRFPATDRFRLSETFTATTEWLTMGIVIAAAALAVLRGV